MCEGPKFIGSEKGVDTGQSGVETSDWGEPSNPRKGGNMDVKMEMMMMMMMMILSKKYIVDKPYTMSKINCSNIHKLAGILSVNSVNHGLIEIITTPICLCMVF
jgi:hypothetical protein